MPGNQIAREYSTRIRQSNPDEIRSIMESGEKHVNIQGLSKEMAKQLNTQLQNELNEKIQMVDFLMSRSSDLQVGFEKSSRELSLVFKIYFYEREELIKT
jgi:hypothetical protein